LIQGELLTRTQATPALLEEFLIRREKIGRFLIARLGNTADAEDALQEMFIRLSRAQTAAEIKDRGAYLFRMAMNVSRDHRRDRARARAREGLWAETQYTIQAGTAVLDAPPADSSLAARQLLVQVRNALAELSPQCQRVFRMHKFEAMPHREVAEALGISRRTVEKHMHTALQHLTKRVHRD